MENGGSDPVESDAPPPDQSQTPPPSSSEGVTSYMAGSLLHNLIFLNWAQYPPLPLTPDLSDPCGQVVL